jgi:cupin 2 domain-containing protein
MTRVFEKAAYATPVDFSAVESDWGQEGFGFGVFRDPPGQEWNNFTHRTDEYVLVAEGQLRIDVGKETAVCEAGDLVRIPRHIAHSLKTLSGDGSVWLYGYGNWSEAGE